ncbi:MAG: 3-oxoacyl-ACP synthase [Trueperaceae bacterium]|nr:3-oxoacyl-ACP synthase [Trueperaceae bacterium]
MIGIIGVGVYLPDTRLDAADIARETELPEGVVRDKLGICSKPVPGEGDHPTAMGVWAAERALAEARIDPQDVDVVISITEEYKEFPVWTAGIKLAYDVGAEHAYAYDIGQKCGTGVLGIKQAHDLIKADDSVDTVLVAGGYRNGDLIDYRNERVRFMYNLGAGGAAAVVRRGAEQHGADGFRAEILQSAMITDGSLSRDVVVPVGGTIEPLTPDNLHRYKLDVTDPAGMRARLGARSLGNFIGVIEKAVAKSGFTVDDIDHLAILHMKRSAHEQILAELGLEPERSIYLSDYGHIGQVDQFLSVQLAEQQGRLEPGSLIVMVAAGVGYVWNAICLRYLGPR